MAGRPDTETMHQLNGIFSQLQSMVGIVFNWLLVGRLTENGRNKMAENMESLAERIRRLNSFGD